MRGREISGHEVLSDVEVPWRDRAGTSGIDVWKLITDPEKPGFFCFWFDRSIEEAPFEYTDQEDLPWKTP